MICEHCSANGECKIEWKNRFENDGTPDNSAWTSIETDGILETSPSIDNVMADDDLSPQSLDEEETSLLPDNVKSDD